MDYTPEHLKDLLKRHGIARKEAAERLAVTPDVLKRWTLPESSNGHRPMPQAAWELLLLQCGEHPDYVLAPRSGVVPRH